MIRVAIFIAVIAACTNDRRPPAPTSGSAALAPIATIPLDAAPLDAPEALYVMDSCGVGDNTVTCIAQLATASLRGKHCWHAVVAVEDHLAASVDIVTSSVACTTDLVSGGAISLDITGNLEEHCALRDGCETLLVDETLLAAETTKLHDRVIAGLTSEQEARRRTLSTDHREIVNSDWKRLRDHFNSLNYFSLSAPQEYVQGHADMRREFDMMTLRVSSLTKGKVACAVEAEGPASFVACLQDHVDVVGDLRFPFLSERAITADEIAALSTDDLVLARNEIYARHGYTFKHADLAEYFAKQAWYKPDPAYDESSLTAIERDNVHALLTAEKSRGK